MRTSILCLALALGVLAIGAPGATAASYTAPSKLVFVCGKDLCGVDPATKKTSRVTKDGAGYGLPSVSNSGRRLAAVRAGKLVIGATGKTLGTDLGAIRGIKDVTITPDGAGVAATQWYTELKLHYRYRYVCGGACLVWEIETTAGVDYYGKAAPPSNRLQGTAGAGFLGSALLSTGQSSGTYNSDSGAYEGRTETICVVANPSVPEGPCVDKVILPVSGVSGAPQPSLSYPTGSPDGKLIAAVLGTDTTPRDGRIVDNPAGDNPAIVLYSAATGAPVRTLATNGSEPSFSPDGRSIAYAGTDGWVYVVPTAGGKRRRIVRGLQPSWGADPRYVSAAGAAVPAKSLRYRRQRVRVRVGCGGTATCTGKLAIARGKRTIGRRSYRIKAGRSATVSVKPTAGGRRAIARKQRVAVRVKPKKGKAATFKLTLRR